jgi:hypothetical protein
MAAIFYSINQATDVFRGGFQVNTSVRVPFLSNLVGPNGYAVVNSVSVNSVDTVQYFLTFDDLISYFYFGKGLGAMNISGLIFADCGGFMPGIDIFYSQIARWRGRTVDISFGSAVFRGVISNFTCTANAEPDNTVEWSVTLNIIDHSLPAANFTPLC